MKWVELCVINCSEEFPWTLLLETGGLNPLISGCILLMKQQNWALMLKSDHSFVASLVKRHLWEDFTATRLIFHGKVNISK